MIPRALTYSNLQPTIHEIGRLEDLNTSSELWFNQVVKNTGSDPNLGKSVGSYVDVRDVASANVLALEKGEAGGQRILVSTGGSSRPQVPGRSLISPPSSIYLAGYE